MQDLLDHLWSIVNDIFNVVLVNLESQLPEHLLVESLPVYIFGSRRVGWLIVVELHEATELILHNFSHENSIGEVSGEVTCGSTEGHAVDPLQHLFHLLFAHWRRLHESCTY